MVDVLGIRTDVDNFLNEYGEIVLVRRADPTYSGAEYDIEYLDTTDSRWVRALIQPINLNNKNSAVEAKFMEQGRLSTKDKIFYFAGSVALGAIDTNTIRIQVGSPTSSGVYTILDMGVTDFAVSGTTIYRKAYGRILEMGSFIYQIT